MHSRGLDKDRQRVDHPRTSVSERPFNESRGGPRPCRNACLEKVPRYIALGFGPSRERTAPAICARPLRCLHRILRGGQTAQARHGISWSSSTRSRTSRGGRAQGSSAPRRYRPRPPGAGLRHGIAQAGLEISPRNVHRFEAREPSSRPTRRSADRDHSSKPCGRVSLAMRRAPPRQTLRFEEPPGVQPRTQRRGPPRPGTRRVKNSSRAR